MSAKLLFRAEVRQDGGRWTITLPGADMLMVNGTSLLQAEHKARVAVADKFHIGPDDVCLQLQDRMGIARERPRRPTPERSARTADERAAPGTKDPLEFPDLFLVPEAAVSRKF